jgi:hypothetical protein
MRALTFSTLRCPLPRQLLTRALNVRSPAAVGAGLRSRRDEGYSRTHLLIAALETALIVECCWKYVNENHQQEETLDVKIGYPDSVSYERYPHYQGANEKDLDRLHASNVNNSGLSI